MKLLSEKLVNSVKETGRKSWKTVKDNAKIGIAIAGIAGATLGGITENAKADYGSLRIINTFEPMKILDYYPGFCFLDYYPSRGSDGYDGEPTDFEAELRIWDGVNGLFPNSLGLYSEIPNHNLQYDGRNNDSNKPFDLKLFYYGDNIASRTNRLHFYFYVHNPLEPNETFADKPILFQSDRLPYGPVVDVRELIKNGGDIPTLHLKDLAPGDYLPLAPYGSAILTIGTRLLSDLSGDGKVGMKDFAILASQWGKPQGTYTGDISGPNAVPDGYVYHLDLRAFSKDYLKDVNDSNTISKLNPVIKGENPTGFQKYLRNCALENVIA